MAPNSADASDHSSPITIELRPAGSRFAAIVTLRGEHDLATAPELEHALREVAGNVLVDLSPCEFIDSTAIGALVSAARRLERDGSFLELVVAPENTTIGRTLEIAGVAALIVVHPARPASARSDDR